MDGWQIDIERAQDGWKVTLEDPDRLAYVIEIEFGDRDEEDQQPSNVTAIRVSCSDGAVLSRDVRRMPLDAYVKAARSSLTLARIELMTEAGHAPPRMTKKQQRELLGISHAWERAQQDLATVTVPRGRPQAGRSTKWYADLLASARQLEAQGKSANRELARRKHVSENTIRQWIHRARKLEEREKGTQ